MLVSVANATTPELSSDTATATAGFFQLKWSGGSLPYELQESLSPDFTSFKTLYRGTDLASVISGKPDGEYYYRIVVDNNKQTLQSNTVKISVLHHPLLNAFLFFIAGAVVFAATLILIIKGNRQHTV